MTYWWFDQPWPEGVSTSFENDEQKIPIEKPKPEPAKLLHPYCQVCGWRKGGPDSWDGKACKCKLTEPPMSPLENDTTAKK